MDSESDSAASEPVALVEDLEWQDVEDDTEDLKFVSLFDDHTFSSVREMFIYCKERFDFDFWQIQCDLQLDDIEKIKLINYVRTEGQTGSRIPNPLKKSSFEDDKYLKPVLEDDAVLYSLEDVLHPETADENINGTSEVEDLRKQLASLQVQFETYRQDVRKSFTNRIGSSKIDDNDEDAAGTSDSTADDDYFKSYSYNSIHRLMLSDKVRTDAYRDFIYDNKDLFAGKTVLDVGCGTGILSMLCAKAGARQVIAVDNSDIISKARENIRLNRLDDRILCLKGKIEEVTLPIANVDIIVSEWMGYCLLYESMLDSVLYARDKYLVKGGLMVPSHATLCVAPLSDSNLRVDHIDFWSDVYGFNMTPMLEKACEEALIQTVTIDELATGSKAENAYTFNILDLHTVTVAELSFEAPFNCSWETGTGKLEGFVIWFDIFFARNQSKHQSLDMATAGKNGLTAFSTGPFTTSTHWQQGVLLIDEHGEKKGSKSPSFVLGDMVKGTIRYSRKFKESRSLQIDVSVVDNAGQKALAETWKLI